MDKKEYRKMVISYQQKDDPTGWFDHIYRSAKGDHTAVFWADLVPSPYLLEWLRKNLVTDDFHKSIAIGCGVGDDAEAMAKHGYQVTAFDIAPSAIDLCDKRYPDSSVHYLVADLFDYPEHWQGSYDLVYECNTIQVLPDQYRIQALKAMVSLLAPGGCILVSCRSRNAGEQEDDIPLPLDKYEIDGFVRFGLIERSFLAYDDDQQPSVPHFFACYQRPVN